MSDITRDYSFGGWLRQFRIDRDITLRRAAEMLSMDPGNLSKLERSENEPPKDKLGVMAVTMHLGLPERNLELLVSLAFQHHLSKLKQRFK